MKRAMDEINVVEGHLEGRDARIGIVVSRFNTFITERLLEGALDALTRHGVAAADITVVRVPGAWEIPALASRLTQPPRVDTMDALICLGAVIRGGTPHFDYVAAEVAKGVAAVGARSPIPVIFGVLTTDTIEQAIERAGTKAGNKGFDAGVAALEMLNLYRSLR